MKIFDEQLLRRALAAWVAAGLLGGLVLHWGWLDPPVGIGADTVWSAATVPVIVALAVSMLRDLLIGRVGVDAIALVSMSAALVLDQPLAAAVVALMYSGGVLLEDLARGRAERSLRALEDRSPRTAHRVEDGDIDTVPVAQVAIGDELLVRAGELVPVDGLLLADEARLDEAALTGEPLPVTHLREQLLRSGTVNAGDAFAMRATARAGDSTYAGILRLVAAAHTARAPFIRMADRFALLLLPVALVVAAAAWQWSGDPLRGLAVLVVATPCPLILAAPVAFIGGISQAARKGILLKGSPALEALGSVRTAIFDKTGTLTTGGAELLGIDLAPGFDQAQVMQLAASLEQASRHVVAATIVELARRERLVLTPPVDVRELRGAGLAGRVGDRYVRVGSRDYVLDGAELPDWAAPHGERLRHEEVLRVHVEIDGTPAAILTFGDAPRADARATLEAMKRLGIARLVMLTGDDDRAARRLTTRLPFDRVVAHATPEQKVAIVREEMAEGPVMMIGDGINDAPALATATVGVAMGARGATASSEAADVVVLPDRLAPVADALAISRRTRAIAMQSIVAGLALSGAAMAIAFAGLITPVQGALIQEAIDLAVIANALRALRPPPIDRHQGIAPRLAR